MTDHEPDLAARERALDPARSFIVQAPAGSGKTGLLLQRFLALIPTVAEPEEIVAITFTRKAAAEIRSRVLAALFEAESAASEQPYAARTRALAAAARAHAERRGWRLRETPGRLQARTIDSFCEQLARAHPLASGIGTRLRTVDYARRHYDDAARRVLRAESAALERILFHVDNDMGYLRRLLVGMLATRDQWLRHLRDGEPAALRAELEEVLASVVTGALERALGACPAHVAADLPALASFAGSNARRLEKDPRLAALAGMTALPAARLGAIPAWRGLAALVLTNDGHPRRTVNIRDGFPAAKDAEDAEEAKEMKARMTALLGELREAAAQQFVEALSDVPRLPAARYGEEQWQRVLDLTDLLRSAVSHLERVFAEAEEIDHAEVLLSASQSVARLDPRRLPRHLLVDEFQDTSIAQYRLIAELFAGSDGHDGRTLFLVGDPMQSIYRFREAEVGNFLEAWRGRLGSVRLEPLALRVNYRSRRGVVEAVNEIFARVLPAQADPERGRVPYTRFYAEPESAGGTVTADAWLAPDAEGEALRVIELAASARAAGETVALLARNRNHVALILERLRESGIACQAVDFVPLGERPVVRDLRALTAALLFPADRLAWLSVLRAPWCGLSLADLHALAAHDDRLVPELLADEEALGRLSSDGRRRAQATFAVLDHARAERQRGGFARGLRAVWLRLGGAAAGDGADAADAEAYFELVAEVERDGEIADLAQLDARVESLYARRGAASAGAVQVMTIHKAKGLEFDCVIVPALGRISRGDAAELLLFHERVSSDSAGGGLLLAPLPERYGTEGDAIYEYLRATERERSEEELRRLLYVALTRAKSRIHLTGHVARTAGDGTPRPEGRSALAAIWPGVARMFLDAAASRGAPQTAPPRERGVQPPIERFPAAWRPPPPAADACAARGVARAGRDGWGGEYEKERAREYVAGGRARAIGVVLHRLLERVANEGLAAWDAGSVARRRESIRAALLGEGVLAGEADAAAAEVVEMVERMLGDDRGRWILGRHDGAASEMPLASAVANADEAEHMQVDRTFIDAGVRWIIDYKSSAHEGAALTEFIRLEGERYAPQLARYRNLFAALEPGRPVRSALYYPRFAHFQEIR
ncbi:MAG: UvrD-helicase domain-containing protein [Planctomycetes bacterium]|nr:UvrD-helicase domain-containing protein [Planctomycetota bacterium]